jgi:hypothetical protein
VIVGPTVGVIDGNLDGLKVGSTEGMIDGVIDGDLDGRKVGNTVGKVVDISKIA